MAEDLQVDGLDRVLLSGVKNAIAGLSAEELSSLRRVLNMKARIAPVAYERSEALRILRDIVGERGSEDSVEALTHQVVNYIDRSLLRLESGLRTWLGVEAASRLRQLGAGEKEVA